MTNLEDRITGAMNEISDLASEHATHNPRSARAPDSDRRRRSSVARVVASAVAVAALIAAASVGGYYVLNPSSSVPFAGGADESDTDVSAGGNADPSRFDVDDVAVQLTDFAGDPGYGGVRVDYDAGLVAVQWKGEPPDKVDRLVGMHDNGVEVTLTQSRYSEPELAQAGRELADALVQRYGRDKVAAILPNADRSGLIVEMVRPWDGDVVDIANLVDYPVKLKLVDHPVVPAAP